MMRHTRVVVLGMVVCAIACLAVSTSHAATIIKLNLGGVGPDVAMPAAVLGTMSDGVAATTGDQNTDIEYTGFLDGSNPDITTTDASFTLSGLLTDGPPTVFGGSLVVQPFIGGTFTLHNNDALNTVLLTGPMTTSVLTGVIGPPGTGALFTTTLGAATGGTLAPLLAPGSVSLSMNMTNVDGGFGFGTGAGPILLPFSADSSVSIGADPIPEPTSLVLALLSSVAALAIGRRPHR